MSTVDYTYLKKDIVDLPSHSEPLKPSGQSHTGAVATIEQLPPFWHGLTSHSVMIGTSQSSPE